MLFFGVFIDFYVKNYKKSSKILMFCKNQLKIRLFRIFIEESMGHKNLKKRVKTEIFSKKLDKNTNFLQK